MWRVDCVTSWHVTSWLSLLWIHFTLPLELTPWFFSSASPSLCISDSPITHTSRRICPSIHHSCHPPLAQSFTPGFTIIGSTNVFRRSLLPVSRRGSTCTTLHMKEIVVKIVTAIRCQLLTALVLTNAWRVDCQGYLLKIPLTFDLLTIKLYGMSHVVRLLFDLFITFDWRWLSVVEVWRPNMPLFWSTCSVSRVDWRLQN